VIVLSTYAAATINCGPNFWWGLIKSPPGPQKLGPLFWGLILI
jgi:hypothetical protein